MIDVWTLLEYLPYLALTLAVEVPLACVFARAWRRTWAVALLLNLTTHPLGMAAMLSGGTFFEVGAAVLLAEVLGYRLVGGLSLPRAALVAFVCNLATVGLAFLLRS